MYVRVKATAKPDKNKVQICESIRQGARVSQVIVRHVGIAHNEQELDDLKRLAKVLIAQLEEERHGPFLFPLDGLESETPVDCTQPLSVPPLQQSNAEEQLQEVSENQPSLVVDLNELSEQQRVVEGFHDVFGHLFNTMGFSKILPRKQSEVLREVVLARIANPASKRATQETLTADFGVDIHLDRIYRMMDSLIEKQEDCQRAVFAATQALCFDRVNITFFDVTTLYFESTEEDELRRFGYSKDQQFHSVQVVLALATTQDGLPIGYRAFPGNTAEVSTLLACLADWRKRLPIGDVCVVADRAMMSDANLEALEQAGIKYVIAAKLKKLPKEVRESLLKKTGTSIHLGEELHNLQEQKLSNGRRLVVTHSEKRASKDKHDREAILEKVKKKIGKGKNVKKLVSNRGYQRYLKAEGNGTVTVDEAKLAEDARWDGLHGVITNDLEATPLELLQRYRRLWVIEESFRIQKTDLSVRPIYHFKPERIEAHLLICYLAFALIRHAEHHTELQGIRVSVQEMRRHLWRTQASILKDHKTGKHYRVPSKPDEVARKLYRAFGLIRNQKIHLIE